MGSEQARARAPRGGAAPASIGSAGRARPGRRRLHILAFLAVIAAVAAMVYSSGANFTATTANASNTFSSGILAMDNSLPGGAVLTVERLVPGETRSGSVTITNSGDVTGQFFLEAVEIGAETTLDFDGKLDLLITDAQDAVIYSGKLRDLPRTELTADALGGLWGPGSARTYTFTVTFPSAGRDANGVGLDNQYKQAVAAATFTWTAVSVPDAQTAAGGAGETSSAITVAQPSFTTAGASAYALDGVYAPYRVASNPPFKSYIATSGGALRLTDETAWTAGAAFSTQPIKLAEDRSFSALFTISIYSSTGNGADGMAFVLQRGTSSPNRVGGAMGFFGRVDSQPQSVAVEFDTFPNWGDDDGTPVFDPRNHHIGLNLGGSQRSAVTATPPGSLSGQPWTVWVDYDGSKDLFEVRMSQSGTRPQVATLSQVIDLAPHLGTTVYAGFTAATGGLAEVHEVRSFYVASTYLAGGLDPAAVK